MACSAIAQHPHSDGEHPGGLEGKSPATILSAHGRPSVAKRCVAGESRSGSHRWAGKL